MAITAGRTPDSVAMAIMAAQNISLRTRLLPPTTREFAERYRGFRIPTTPWFHIDWYEAFDDPAIPLSLLLAPREHAKTSVVLTYALRRLAENRHVRVGIISGTDPLAKKFLSELKHELESNEALTRDYGGGQTFVGAKWTEHELVLRGAHSGPGALTGKDVSVFAVGRNGQVSSRHCDLLVLDDVESADTVKSDLVRAATREWFSREVLPVLSPGGKMIVVGTRKHFDDLYSYLLKPESGFGILDKAKAVYKADGTPIWPEMWDAPSLAAKKATMDAQDVLAWPQEYLNQPLPGETQMFRPEQWPTYPSDDPFSFAMRRNLSIIQFWDLAISEKTTADYTVGFTIGVDDSNSVYILERRRGHWDFQRTLAEIGDMGTKWPTVITVGIEQVAYQAAAVQEALRRTMLPIVPVVPDKDKVTRARLLEARAAAGKVVRPDSAPWWTEFATEASFFPAAAHDDQIDALAGALRLAGWEASVVNWSYGIWKCPRCAHMFSWAAKRPCPKCGTPAAETFENPEGELPRLDSLGVGR